MSGPTALTYCHTYGKTTVPKVTCSGYKVGNSATQRVPVLNLNMSLDGDVVYEKVEFTIQHVYQEVQLNSLKSKNQQDLVELKAAIMAETKVFSMSLPKDPERLDLVLPMSYAKAYNKELCKKIDAVLQKKK